MVWSISDMAALGRLAKTIIPAGLAGGAAYMIASTAVSNNAKAQAEQGKNLDDDSSSSFDKFTSKRI